MNIFKSVKEAVSVMDAASFYGIKINRSGLCNCPFHNDKTPSMKVDDRYYCFGCGATGDGTDFVSRLFDLKPYEAAKRIAEDFGLDPDHPPATAALARPKHPMNAKFREDERYCHRVLCDYLHLLEDWRVRYAPTDMESEFDDRFVEACQMFDYIEYLADILTVGDLEIRTAAVKDLMKDGKIGGLEERVRRAHMEEGRDVNHGEEHTAA